MDTLLVTLGIGCIVAAIVGGGLKLAGGWELPVINSLVRQFLLAAFGAVLLVAAETGAGGNPTPPRGDEAPQPTTNTEQPPTHGTLIKSPTPSPTPIATVIPTPTMPGVHPTPTRVTTVPTTAATGTSGMELTINKVVESNTRGVSLTLTTVELLPKGEMRWNFLFANDSDEDRGLYLVYNATRLSDERGQSYPVLRDSFGNRSDDRMTADLRVGERLALWIDFPPPKDGASDFTVALEDRQVGFPAFKVALKYDPS